MSLQDYISLTFVEDVAEAPQAMAQEEPNRDELLLDQHLCPPWQNK